MTPTQFPECNASLGPPSDLDESQVSTIKVFVGELVGGTLDGARCYTMAWMPDDEERTAIVSGAPIYLTCIGSVPPHFLTAEFPKCLKT